MSKFKLYFIICLLSVLLVSCYRINLDLTTEYSSLEPEFDVSAGILFKDPIMIDNFHIYRLTDNTLDHVWGFSPVGDTHPSIRIIHYGVTPEGYEETIAAKKLLVDVEYTLVVQQGDSHLYNTLVIIRERGHYIYQLQEWFDD